MLCHAPRPRILCKKYHKEHTRAFMSESYRTPCVCKHFNIKTSKTQCFFTKMLWGVLSDRRASSGHLWLPAVYRAILDSSGNACAAFNTRSPVPVGNRHRGRISCTKPAGRCDFGPQLCQLCFLCCGRAGGTGHAMLDSLELASLTPTPTPTPILILY